MRVRRITNTRMLNKTYNDVTGNSGVEEGFITNAENSESAKLFPFKFSNPIVTGPVKFDGKGTLIVFNEPSLLVLPDLWKITLLLPSITEKS